MDDRRDGPPPAPQPGRRPSRQEQQRQQARRDLERRQFLRAGLVGGAAAVVGGTYLFENDVLGGSDGSSAVADAAVPDRAKATTTTRPPRQKSIYSKAVKAENAKPGSNAWNIWIGADDSIQGYFDTTSAAVGDTPKLFVSTTSPQWKVEAWRMGWYNGAGGRLIWSSPMQTGIRQPGPNQDSKTNMIAANWTNPLPIEIDDSFVPGCYLFRLSTTAGDGRMVPLTIRDDSSKAAYLFMNAVTTWQAYNLWGGYSLYWGRVGSGQTFANRSRIVSFDRPYDTNGAPEFLGFELPVIQLVERLGLDVTYATNVDVHRAPERVKRHRALLSLGHDEYYSKAMRDGAEAARDAGVNLAFFGANAAYRQIRFESSDLGDDRHQVCYKSASEDPLSAADPTLTTVNWRDAPINRPENQLIGNQYESNPVSADLLVTNPEAWIFEGTGLKGGDRLRGVVGGEYDRWYPGPGVPENVEVFAHSPLVCNGKASYGDMTYYTAPSGAGVFACGTQTWTTNLDQKVMLQPIIDMTTNVLLALGPGPAGQRLPSQSNTQGLSTTAPVAAND